MDTLVKRYQRPLFSFLMRKTGSQSDADDLFQEVWIRIIRNADRFEDKSFRAWMNTISRNVLTDFYRKKKPSVSLDAVEDEDSEPMVDRLESKEISPIRSVEFDEMSRKVLEAVEELPDIQKEVLRLKHVNGLSFSEIAAKLKIPLNTALGRMHDAMEKIRKVMGKEVLK